MKKLLGILALSLGLFAGQAHADIAKMYYGLGVTDGSLEVEGGEDDSLGTVNATLGLQLLDFVGLELEVGSASDQTSSILSDPLFTYQALMVRLGYRWDRAGVYLLGGQGRADASGSSTSDSFNAFGFGINLFGNETTALNLHVLDLDDGAFKTATIGFQYYFGGFR